ncbi:MAG: hydrogenase maturation protease, partial [Gemmatimonadota bacterium]
MKPTLILGLGNRLMGDDGVACHVAGWLAEDLAVQAEAEVIADEPDLLRVADKLRGRARLFIVDAALDGAPPGTVSVLDAHQHDEPHNGCRQAHAVSSIEALELLRAVGALEPRTRITLLTVSVGSVRIQEELSPELSEMLPAIMHRVKELIVGGS